jgi:hypothetical protein
MVKKVVTESIYKDFILNLHEFDQKKLHLRIQSVEH